MRGLLLAIQRYVAEFEWSDAGSSQLLARYS